MLRRLHYPDLFSEPEKSPPARLYRYLLLAAICLLAAGIRLYGIAPLSVWFDEGIAINAASQPNLWAVMTADPTNPPVITCYCTSESACSAMVSSRYAGVRS